MKIILKAKTWNGINRFFVPFDSTKLDLNIINNIVKNRAASSDKGKKQRRKLWHQCVAKSHYLKNISRHTR